MKSGYALYGNVRLVRSWCTDCKSNALVIDGILQCCDRKAEDPATVRRMSEPVGRRKLPPKHDRDEQLWFQDHRCLYCFKSFGSYGGVIRGRLIRVKLVWDHVVPYSYSQDNRSVNFVASCQRCNGAKSSKVFKTIDDARIWLLERAVWGDR
jgi:5-methylcytosine-specific restriction endonuclease McrA